MSRNDGRDTGVDDGGKITTGNYANYVVIIDFYALYLVVCRDRKLPDFA